ncbi:MAG TPA: glycosyltransferase family 2 protein [Ktedonobacterales bacterium]|nr:glycosyltransferase family 2 protein [Ktedonobacterales bacterium]
MHTQLHAQPPEEQERRSASRVPNTVSTASQPMTTRGLSVVLPAWNEEIVIAQTVQQVVEALSEIALDYEVLVVDDGSTDRTGEIADALAAENPRIRVVHNRPNKGYGGALIAGFNAASKELTFFMDADGQFDIRDITRLLEHLDEADAVLGYREHRQDPPLRIVNAWGWKMLMRLLFGLKVRDVDCAFKLYPTKLVRRANVQAQGAMVNTEMLVKLNRLGYTWVEVPVNHYPREGGKASGANLRVILRAFRELLKLHHRIKHEAL